MDVLDLYNKFIKGESVYIIDDSEAAAFRLVPHKDHSVDCFCRRSGTGETGAEWDSDAVIQARLTGREVTKEEYDGFRS